MPFTTRDAALTAMLIVQCFALFVAAPFGALGYSTLATIAELLLVAYVLLVVLISQSRTTAIIALGVSGFGLADGILNSLFPSLSTTLLTHAASIAAFIVLGWVVAQAVFARQARSTPIGFLARWSSTLIWHCSSARFIA